MPTIYAKTADGQHEIDTRSRRIPPRARTLLILVDGKRSDAELFKLVQQGDETLRSLLASGLVEMVAQSGSSRAAEPAAAPAAPEPEPAAPAAPATPQVDLKQRRRDAVRAVNDLLGPEAEGLALKLERAATEDELRAALERAVAYIANARGGGAAAQFAGRFLVTPQ